MRTRCGAIILGVGAAFGMMGCGFTSVPALTVFYTGVQAPEMVTQNAITPKTGEACAVSVLGLFATGNASVQAAAAAGQITKVATVDDDFTAILGFVYQRKCTRVRGE